MIPRVFRPYRGDVKNWKRCRVWAARTSYSISPARLKPSELLCRAFLSNTSCCNKSSCSKIPTSHSNHPPFAQQTTSCKPTLRPPQNAPELDPVNNELSSYLALCFSPYSNTFSLFLCLYTHQKRPQNRFILLILNHFCVIFIIFPLFSLYFAKNHAKNFYPGILDKTIAITAPLVYNKV